MSPITRTTTRRSGATKVVTKIKIRNEIASAKGQHITKRHFFENHNPVPFGNSSTNAQNKKKLVATSKPPIKTKHTKTKAQANAPPEANDKENGIPDESLQHDDRRLEDERIALEREAYYQRRVARMVHSDKPMRFSWRTCYNMTHDHHPDSPIYSPIKAIDLAYAFQHSQVVQIKRSTRDAEMTIRFKKIAW